MAMRGVYEQQTISRKFKVEAVRQVTERGYTVAEVASRLGVTTHSLYAYQEVWA